ncbi:MAG: DNA repair protein RadA [Clostridia bacterium]
MAKTSTRFICQECGYETMKWMGKCPSCFQWDTLSQTVTEKASGTTEVRKTVLTGLSGLSSESSDRIDTGIGEMNRVLGGGVVRGSIILVGGDPGIGKSTILLQLCKSVEVGTEVLYFSGEESISQIGMRAKRLGVVKENILFASETDVESICDCMEDKKPEIVVIDSIQTVSSSQVPSVPGSVTQIRNAAQAFIQTAKKINTSVFLVGHVTKDGTLAGPRILEHMVDTVLYFEGDRSSSFRILRAVKNRFGSTNEIGVFEMLEEGLAEVANPSALFLSGKSRHAAGSCVIPVMEGTRPMLCEIQALVSASPFGMPRRMSTGVDNNRVIMLAAVLEKILGLKLANCDAYVNAAGGLKVSEPACDLAVISAIGSSFKNLPVADDLVVMGEVGLTGEIRGVSNIDKRVREAEKLGYKVAVIPSANLAQARKASKTLVIHAVDHIKRAFEVLFQ